MASLPLNLIWQMAQTKWASILNPVVANPLNSISVLSDVKLANGVTTINHKLGKLMQGWFLIDPQGSAIVYRSAPLNSQTLTLTSSAACTVSIGVF